MKLLHRIRNIALDYVLCDIITKRRSFSSFCVLQWHGKKGWITKFGLRLSPEFVVRRVVVLTQRWESDAHKLKKFESDRLSKFKQLQKITVNQSSGFQSWANCRGAFISSQYYRILNLLLLDIMNRAASQQTLIKSTTCLGFLSKFLRSFNS